MTLTTYCEMLKLSILCLFRRPMRRWEDNIKLDLQEMGWDGMDWIELVWDKDSWQTLVNTVMNLRAS